MQENQLKALLDRLSVSEKVGQLVQLTGDFFKGEEKAFGPVQEMGLTIDVSDVGSVLNVSGAHAVREMQDAYLSQSKNKIPLLFMADVIYGYRTIFPIPLALGCTWNPDLVEALCEVTADEAKAAGVHCTFAPMVDLVNDARWGRCMESPGEDPYLNSCYARSMVNGLQKGLGKGAGIAACVKHFAAYGACQGGRDYNTVDMSRRTLLESYMPAYHAAVNAGCEMVMTSFNTVEGIPATANKWLLNQLLRKEWGFDKTIISDFAAVMELIAHGVAENEKAAAKAAIKAGVDIDMMSVCYANHLKELAEEDCEIMNLLDQAVWRVLKLKNKLGLFENPYYGADEAAEQKLFCNASNRKVARKAAAEAMVLLKNDHSLLPLKKDCKIALIGPYAESRQLMGLWAVNGRLEDTVTLKEAFVEVVDEGCLLCAGGCDFLEDTSGLGDFGNIPSPKNTSLSEEEKQAEWLKAMAAAEASDVIVMALGEHVMQSGEAGSRTKIDLPEIQQQLLAAIKKYHKPIVLLLFSGRPLVIDALSEDVQAIMQCWFPGSEGAHAIADLLFGKVNPSGRLSMGFPYSVGQLPMTYRSMTTGRPYDKSNPKNRFMTKYLDCPNEALYPFGYGLSYHTCEYEKLELNKTSMVQDDTIKVTVQIRNTSEFDGFETVQLYLRDRFASVVRPVKELKSFKKIWIKAHETLKVEFEINLEMLKFYNRELIYGAECGSFTCFVGSNSADERLHADFELMSE